MIRRREAEQARAKGLKEDRISQLPDPLICQILSHLPSKETVNEATFERLVSSCPVLEDLKINVFWKDGNVYRVHSLSLKRLRLTRRSSFPFDSVPGVIIDAPLLCCLEIDDTSSESFIVNNMGSSAKLDIDLEFGLLDFDEASVSSGRSRIHSFLPGILKVMDMKISEGTFKVIHHYSKFEPLPQFDYMSRLHATVYVADLKGLQTFLKGCPNLKYLILVMICYNDFGFMGSDEMNQISFLAGISRVIMDLTISTDTFKALDNEFEKMCPEEMNQISFSSVPECVLSSLEFVDYNISFSRYAAEMKLVKYFLENSAVLKKISLRFYYCPEKEIIFKELLKILRRSSICQVVVL